MEMVPFDGDADDWCHRMLEYKCFSPPPLCSSSSSSSSPFAVRTTEDICLPIAAVPPSHLQLPQGSGSTPSYGAFAAADFSSSLALVNLREDAGDYLPMFSAAPPAVVGDQYDWCSQLPAVPADAATAGLDDALLQLPFSDIDLEAFGNNADEQKPAIVPANHQPGAAGVTANNVIQHAVVDVQAHQKPPVAVEGCCFRPGANGFELEAAAVRRHHPGEHNKPRPRSVAAAIVPRPRGARRCDGRSAPAGKTRLDHVGFDDLRKYFYMPITRAAREMNVGLTVLKKRCRELGVARWPHRKMKSLKSLIVNVQEMGNGMPPAAVQQELLALETYCALMEEDPSIELTERTKKLRQACFKESYKRRRAAAVVSAMDMDHVYSFTQNHRRQLRPPQPSNADADRHGQSTGFFGY
ncbi:hypothetical protein BS78_03G163000 [Paspalum vaginatum]|nr:hypothetical protein BS78_03G163000 [Paspalum vaginatum]